MVILPVQSHMLCYVMLSVLSTEQGVIRLKRLQIGFRPLTDHKCPILPPTASTRHSVPHGKGAIQSAHDRPLVYPLLLKLLLVWSFPDPIVYALVTNSFRRALTGIIIVVLDYMMPFFLVVLQLFFLGECQFTLFTFN